MKVLIVGVGIAGLTAAIEAHEQGDDVVLLSKEEDQTLSSSSWAQGGVAYRGVKDSPRSLFKDVEKAGDGMVREGILKDFCLNAPQVLKQVLIDKVGVPFARETTATKNEHASNAKASNAEKSKNGQLKLTKEAAHSKRRIIFCNDNTGEVIIKHLLAYLKKQTKVKVQSARMVVDLITVPHHAISALAVYEDVEAVGAYVLNTRTGAVESIFADKIILATGGVGQIYKHTTNPSTSTGDGIALAMRAGVRIVNMEFTQFHPTSLATKKNEGFLISEALRGEGAVIVNEAGEEFLKRGDPRGSLAPRDVVSRAIWREQIRTQEPHVYLSMEKMRGVDIAKRFPTIYQQCKKLHIDIAKYGKIPVTPAFHFSCGGILADAEGRSSLNNLFAVGECACSGIHGANRLASTSLLEGLYFAQRAARVRLSQNVIGKKRKWGRSKVRAWQGVKRGKRASVVRIIQEFAALKSLMWNYAGIIRSLENLQLGIEELTVMKKRIDAMYRESKLSKQLLELRNAVSVAMLIADSAIKNPVSKGCHFRAD